MYENGNDLEFGVKLLVGLVLIGMFVIMSIVCCVGDEKVWNGGIHNGCGGQWIYEQAVGHRYRTNYIYKCDKCGMRYEFGDMR